MALERPTPKLPTRLIGGIAMVTPLLVAVGWVIDGD